MVAVLMGDKNAVAVGDVQLQFLEGCAGGADAFAISTMRYRSPQRTTLLLPEEPE